MPVLLVTSDNEQFRVEKVVAQRSVLIKNMLEGRAHSTHSLCHSPGLTFLLDVGESDHPIPLPNVTAPVLKKVSGALPVLLKMRLTILFATTLRCSNTAITIRLILFQPVMSPLRMNRASARQTSQNGTRNSSPLTRRCSLRSFLLPITLISSLFCKHFLLKFRIAPSLILSATQPQGAVR